MFTMETQRNTCSTMTPGNTLVLLWAHYQSETQAPVYHILTLTTAIFSYVIGSWKLSANDFFLLVLKL